MKVVGDWATIHVMPESSYTVDIAFEVDSYFCIELFVAIRRIGWPAIHVLDTGDEENTNGGGNVYDDFLSNAGSRTVTESSVASANILLGNGCL